MAERRAVLTVTAGPNQGDSVRIDFESCRLIGRHLSEHETVFIDRDGNRGLDTETMALFEEHLKRRGSQPDDQSFDVSTFERGADIILADDSISRAHAMVFFDKTGVGVVDLASTNGTLVNNRAVTSEIVEDGDTIALGNSELVVSYSG